MEVEVALPATWLSRSCCIQEGWGTVHCSVYLMVLRHAL